MRTSGATRGSTRYPGDLGQRLEGREVVRILDRGDQLAVLDHERHALVLERLRRLEEPHGRPLGPLEHRAGRDRNAELEAEVDRERLEIDEPVLDQDRPEPAAVPGLVLERLPRAGLRSDRPSRTSISPSFICRRRYHGASRCLSFGNERAHCGA